MRLRPFRASQPSDDIELADGTTERRFVALTDILGAEDAFGDMDFKVAGTKDFVTALQLDTKLDGIPSQVLAAALSQAKDARATILEVMAEAIDAPDEMRATPLRSAHAARFIPLFLPHTTDNYRPLNPQQLSALTT